MGHMTTPSLTKQHVGKNISSRLSQPSAPGDPLNTSSNQYAPQKLNAGAILSQGPSSTKEHQ